MRAVILLSWRRAMYYWWVPLAQVWNKKLMWYFLFLGYYYCWNQLISRAAIFFYIYIFLCILTFGVRIGKTLLAKTLARVVNVPFAVADATTLTHVSSLLYNSSLLVQLYTNISKYLFICQRMWSCHVMMWQKHKHLSKMS